MARGKYFNGFVFFNFSMFNVQVFRSPRPIDISCLIDQLFIWIEIQIQNKIDRIIRVDARQISYR